MSARQWTPTETTALVKCFPHHPTSDVAMLLECKPSRVSAKAHALGLSKSPEYKASAKSGRIQRGQQHPKMVATRFQVGAVPWNKGVKGSTGGHPNSIRQQFKRGEMSGAAQRNYLPIGSLRVSKDGYLERKMTDDPNLAPSRRWTAVHRLVWQAQMGPIPRGHVICFRPGQKTAVEAEITTERLECVSRATLAKRNHPRNKSPELARLVQLKGAITRQVNRIAREHDEMKAAQP